MNGRVGRWGLALLLAALASGALALPSAIADADADGASPTYYLAIGASESLGVQPAPGRLHGAPTDRGYANDLVGLERSRWPGLELAQVGCPGVTAVAAIEGGGRCPYPAGSQLATALSFLRSHTSSTVLVTVDLGFNDLRRCLAGHVVDTGCVGDALDELSRILPGALNQIEAVAGDGVQLVGLLHNDPYLGDYVEGQAAQAFALASVAVVDQLNDVLRGAYSRAGVAIADVTQAFALGDTTPVATANGPVPAEVAKVCALSWACDPGHNVHPNDAGYAAIAATVAAAIAGAGS